MAVVDACAGSPIVAAVEQRESYNSRELFRSIACDLHRILLRGEQTEIFPGHGGAGERGGLGAIVRRADLDQVHADELQAGKPPQDRLRLPGREPADFRRAGARRESRIERVKSQGKNSLFTGLTLTFEPEETEWWGNVSKVAVVRAPGIEGSR